MCLIEIKDLGRTAFVVDPGAPSTTIALEPLTLAGELTQVSGRLVSMRPVPACPSFRQITVRRPDGSGTDVVVSESTLLFVYCTEDGTQ